MCECRKNGQRGITLSLEPFCPYSCLFRLIGFASHLIRFVGTPNQIGMPEKGSTIQMAVQIALHMFNLWVTLKGGHVHIWGMYPHPIKLALAYWKRCIKGAWQVPTACLQFAVYHAYTTCNELPNESARVERRSKESPGGGAHLDHPPDPPGPPIHLFHVHLIVASIKRWRAPESMQLPINSVSKIITCNCGRHKA